ncbi:MAG TPA: GNAT family N-acetyltransferase [Bacteroidia bacterium]|nr:GNAT family N-acetyltransferase [Bacteroidia bacterium]
MQFVQVKYPDVKLLQQFINEAGTSLKSFRYFQKRPLDVIKNHLCTFLLLDGEKPVAYGHLDVSDEVTIASHCDSKEEGLKTEKTIWLGIAVSENYTGKGLGLMMMNQLISFAKNNGVRQIKLSVDNDNETAISFYKKSGFVLLEKKEMFGFYGLNL